VQHNEDVVASGSDDDYDEAEEEIHKNEGKKSDNELEPVVEENDVRLLYHCRASKCPLYCIMITTLNILLIEIH